MTDIYQYQETYTQEELTKLAFADSARYFPTALQQFQFFDKYSRFDYTLGRRETWLETVTRAVDFMYELAGDRLEAETYSRIRRGILEMKVMPSMRLLAMAGPAARRSHITLYNCSYQPVESIDVFVEALIISMSGCGVGFSVEREYVEQFPRVKRQTGQLASSYLVEDTAEGWSDALRVGLQTWFEGGDIKFDLSQLRTAGAPLKTKGGRASGPEPLRTMLEFVRNRILSRQGSFIRPLDAHDIMCIVGNAAVSGGVRRTAMLSLFDYDDDEMRNCKNGDFERDNSQRWNANNSAVWPSDLTQSQLLKQFSEMVESGRGEPGIFNRESVYNMLPTRRSRTMTMPDGTTDIVRFGTNPCVTGDTWVFTKQGPFQVKELEGVQHQTYVNGLPILTTSQGFWKTGFKPVYKFQTKEGYELRLTENHQLLKADNANGTWCAAGDFVAGDKVILHRHDKVTWNSYGSEEEGWLLGQLVGNGTFSGKTAYLDFYGEHAESQFELATSSVAAKFNRTDGTSGVAQKIRATNHELSNLAFVYDLKRGNKTITAAIERGSSKFYCGFLRGLFDADGTVLVNAGKGNSVRLSQSDLPILQGVQRMLMRLGIFSTIYQNRHEAGLKPLPDGKGGSKLYNCKANHELVITRESLLAFAERVGFSKPDKAAKLQTVVSSYKRNPYRSHFTATFTQFIPDGMEQVFDCSVPNANRFDANGMVAHNCGEIILRPWQFCNLSAVIARTGDTYESLQEKVGLATIIGSIQSMATNFPGLRSVWKQNCEEERLLGIDITGQLDCPMVQQASVKSQLRDYAIEVNRLTAPTLGINQAASVTCVKPSGNTSQLVDCSSGLHARHSEYYIRNVRVSAHSPVYKALKDAGVPHDPENGSTWENATTFVIHFPTKAPDGSITRNGRTAIEQCEYWLNNKLNWTEHNASVTITYKPDEILAIVQWVWEHRDQIGGMAFLPSFDSPYAQLPYIEITKDEYERLAAEFPPVDFSKITLYEDSDLTNAAQELACVAGNCDL
jgi:ribonucleotide reductase class II